MFVWIAHNKVSEIGLVCIYALSSTHSRRTIVITCMFGSICRISIRSFLIICIWSRNLFTYFIASLRHHSWRSSFWFLMLLNMNVSFALMTVLYIILIGPTHDSTVVFYFWRLMHYTVICVLINMIRRM